MLKLAPKQHSASEPGEWGVWCTTETSVTGHRESWMRRGDDVIRFETEREARETANRNTRLMNACVTSSARYNYVAKRLSE